MVYVLKLMRVFQWSLGASVSGLEVIQHFPYATVNNAPPHGWTLMFPLAAAAHQASCFHPGPAVFR